jgi:hypothetical protein
MCKLNMPTKKAGLRVTPQKPAATSTIRKSKYQRLSPLSIGISRFCMISGCTEPRSGRNGFCEQHDREYYRARYRASRAAYQAWFNSERQRKIEGLLAASSPSERAAIQRGRKAGRELRREVEALI